MNKSKILIADNDEHIVSLLKSELAKEGYEIITAYDGAEALKKIRTELPDLIILDLLMPKIDGYRLCLYLREDPTFADIPIIAVSGMAIEDEERIKKLKANYFLAKTRLENLISNITLAINTLLFKYDKASELTKVQESSFKNMQARQMVRELLFNKLHLEEILNSMADGVIEIDEHNNILYANFSALTLLQKKEKDIIGKLISSCFAHSDAIETCIIDSISNKKKKIIYTDNNNQNLKIHFTPFYSQERYQGGVLLIENITDEIRNIKEIEKRNRELEFFKDELERRLTALNFFYELAQKFTSQSKYEKIIDTLVESLSKIFKFDALTLITESENIFHLRIESEKFLPQDILNNIKEFSIVKYSKIIGININENKLDLKIKIGEKDIEKIDFSIVTALDVPLHSNNKVTGLISLIRFEEKPFNEDDKKILNILANQTAETISRVTQVIEGQKRVYESILSSMVDGVIMLDKNNEIIVINNAAKKMLRLTKSESSITVEYLQNKLGFYPFHHLFGIEKRTPGVPIMDEILRLYDRSYHSIICPVFSFSQESIGTVIVLRDITAQKEIEEKKEEFLSVISHELRTPLTSIAGALDMVNKEIVGKLTDKQRRYIELAVENCNRLHLIIDDILDLSKFEKGKMEMTKELFSLPNLIKSSVDRFEPLFTKKNISIDLKFTENMPPLDADPNRISQVMNNLLSNAIKYTPDNGNITIEIFQPKIFPAYVAVSVKDSGPGIKSEDLEKIFNKFETLKYADERAVGGTGLGLAVCRSIIEAHGGKIWAESTYGHGATFIFTLPLTSKDTLPHTLFPPEDRSKLKTTKSEYLVLVVEDDTATSYALKALIMENNYNVMIAENGKEAINKAREFHPDLITMDLKLPDIYGIQIIEILKHDPETQQIPILILSVVEEDEKMYQAGASFYLKKPLEPNKFIEAVNFLIKPSVILRKKVILIIDDDPNVRTICKESLAYLGFEVIEASNGEETFLLLRRKSPDLILLDIMLPEMNGFEIAEKLKSNIHTSRIPIVFLTAKDQPKERIKALKLGIEDYIIKPFDSLELGIRIEGILKRIEDELAASPTTFLPGGPAIEKEISRRISLKIPFILIYLDIDNLKSYNDVYGYAKADAVIKQTGDIIKDVIEKYGSEDSFPGHIAGDDFIIITNPNNADKICIKIIEFFDKLIPLFYNRKDQQRGYIIAEDRYGLIRKFKIMSISIVAATFTGYNFDNYSQLASLSAEYKKTAKSIAGSIYMKDGKKIYPESKTNKEIAQK